MAEIDRGRVQQLNFNDYRDRNTVFERFEGMTPGVRNLTGNGAPEQLSVVAATPGLSAITVNGRCALACTGRSRSSDKRRRHGCRRSVW